MATTNNAFSRLMGPRTIRSPSSKRDKCKRPESWSEYNHNYNPFNPPDPDRPGSYSPYVFGEPYHDDRAVELSKLPRQHTIDGANKRPRTQWVWKLGYAIVDNTKPKKPTLWMCKLCMSSFIMFSMFLIDNRPP
jgi:hypothetical protein